MAKEMQPHRREDDPDGCFERHHRWGDERWESELEPKIRNIVWNRVASAVLVSAGAMIFIALGVVNAQNHIKVEEVDRKIESLKVELHEDLKEVKQDFQKSVTGIEQSQVRMENKIDDILKMHIVLTEESPK